MQHGRKVTLEHELEGEPHEHGGKEKVAEDQGDGGEVNAFEGGLAADAGESEMAADDAGQTGGGKNEGKQGQAREGLLGRRERAAVAMMPGSAMVEARD